MRQNLAILVTVLKTRSGFAGRGLLFILLAFLFLSYPLHAGEDAKFSVAAGSLCRAGQWVRIDVEYTAKAEARCQPQLLLECPTGEKFASVLPQSDFLPGRRYRLGFWATAPEESPVINLQMKPQGSKTGVQIKAPVGILKPVAAGEKIMLTSGMTAPAIHGVRNSMVETENLPDHAELYKGVDLLVIGSLGKRGRLPLSPGQAEAIAEWVVWGGKVLLLDEINKDLIESAAEGKGWRTGTLSPFIVPGDYRADRRPPAIPARKIGRGIIIYLGNHAEAEKVLGGKAVWDKLFANTRGSLPDKVDARLSPERYSRLPGGWPPPPRIEKNALWKWLAIWFVMMTTALTLRPLRENRWLMTAALVLISTLFALAFSRLNPLPQTNTAHALVRVQGANGEGTPSREEDIWIAAPFSSGDEISIGFGDFPPPVPQIPNLRYPALMRTTYDAGANSVSVSLDKDSPTGKSPLIFHRLRSGKVYPASGIIATESRSIIAIDSLPPGNSELFDATVATASGRYFSGGINNLHGEIKFLPTTGNTRKGKSARAIFSDLISREHEPGIFAVLTGWSKGKSDDTQDLGELNVITLNLVRAEGSY